MYTRPQNMIIADFSIEFDCIIQQPIEYKIKLSDAVLEEEHQPWRRQ